MGEKGAIPVPPESRRVRLGAAKNSPGKLGIAIAGRHEHDFTAVELGPCNFAGSDFALIDADRHCPANDRLPDAGMEVAQHDGVTRSQPNGSAGIKIGHDL